ncbi:MAG: hypothetical protein ACI9BK_001893 [Acidimicrobiales bacterium]|jgi:hypothetical protein
MDYVRLVSRDEQNQPASPAVDIRSGREVSADRWNRRFRIEGDAIEALKVIVAGRSRKTFEPFLEPKYDARRTRNHGSGS